MNSESTGILKVVAYFGSQVKVAQALQVNRQTVNSWVKKRNKIPPKKVVEIEKLTGINRWELRPDLWDKPLCSER